MSSPYTGPARHLPYPLDRAVSFNEEMPDAAAGSTLPAFPEDPDERITVFFRWSLNEFVAMATCVDVGRDPAYSTQAELMWWIWATSIMANLCEEVALCFQDQNPTLMDAVAGAIRTNQTIADAVAAAIANAGGATPGTSLTPEQAQSDLTPENIHDGDTCDLNAAWGASLYLTQRAKRAITDFFEGTETLTNTLERMTKLVGLVPAIGNTVENLAGFADEIYEDLKENFEGAYNEDIEDGIACEIFCKIQADCALSIDDIIDIFAERLSTINPTLFASVITFIGTGAFVGPLVVDAMFYLYFTALKFGQAFGGFLGVRPLSQLMGLGADQLASDNWMDLCDCTVVTQAASVYLFDRCGDGNAQVVDFTPGGDPFTLDAIQIGSTGTYYLAVLLPTGQWNLTMDSFTGSIVPPADTNQTAYAFYPPGGPLAVHTWVSGAAPDEFGSHDVDVNVFSPWCGSQGFYAMISNDAPFSASFVATPLP